MYKISHYYAGYRVEEIPEKSPVETQSVDNCLQGKYRKMLKCFLESLGMYTAYQDYTDRAGYSLYQPDIEEPRRLISEAFRWNMTPQGQATWRIIDAAWQVRLKEYWKTEL